MDVDRPSFYPLLLDIITDISTARFVAIDLELTGVPAKGVKTTLGSGRQTLQERYAETKAAADYFQILQIGLTCVEQDLENEKYILKPYNFNLSPLVDERLGIERVFGFQASAVQFLLKSGFDIAATFHDGVPYLSRAEARAAREAFAQRQNKRNLPDIPLKPTETESLAFLELVRGRINSWRASHHPETPDFLVIGSRTVADTVNGKPGEPQNSLSSYEKRLVHQLVRAEYPDLVSLSKRDHIQLIYFDEEREEQHAAGRRKEFEERLQRQKGFRWILDALAGKDVSGIPLREVTKNPMTGATIHDHRDDTRSQLHRAQTFLRHNPRVLIGHNCFIDLIYIYRTFVGSLPDTVEEFQRRIHRLWPTVIDTKYMSTHNCGDINPVSSLDQIAEQLRDQAQPTIDIDEEHLKYQDVELLHEAGYDSLLTAQIAIRLSSKLGKKGIYEELRCSDNSLQAETVVLGNGVTDMQLIDFSDDDYEHVEAPASAGPTSTAEGFTPSVLGGKWKRQGDPTLSPSSPDDVFKYDPTDLTHHFRDPGLKRTFDNGMPSMNSSFWQVYGNKLRVFGTQESMCVLDGQDKMLE